MRASAISLVLLLAFPLVAQEQAPFGETIYVVRYALDVRVITADGRAIDDLQAEDFRVKIGDQVAHVESATWVPLGTPRRPQSRVVDLEFGDDPDEVFAALDAESTSRSIILLVQTDVQRQNDRVLGQMKFNYLADDILEHLGPQDRVAVLSHDSHLKFRLDFTTDHEKIRKAVRDSLFTDVPPPPDPATDGPTLATLLDPKEMKRAAHAEAALLVLSKAMHEIEGEKVMIFAGWGVGEMQGRAGFQLKHEWSEAVARLRDENVPVISLHTGFGGGLATGLAMTASATGGLYDDATGLGDQVVRRVAGVLAGYYALSLRIDDLLEPGKYPLDIRVTRKGAVVQAAPYVIHGR
jgi:hypothetical protein